MDWILGLIILITFVLGYWIMDKIDYFFKLPTTFPETKKYIIYGGVMIVYGNSDFADSLLEILEENDEPYVHIQDESLISFEESYICIFAVDKDDYKNLSISKSARRRFNINNQVILCNDVLYEKIFRNNGEPFVYAEDDPKKMLLIAKEGIEVRKND